MTTEMGAEEEEEEEEEEEKTPVIIEHTFYAKPVVRLITVQKAKVKTRCTYNVLRIKNSYLSQIASCLCTVHVQVPVGLFLSSSNESMLENQIYRDNLITNKHL